MSALEDYQVVRFSTADYPPRERLEAWREVYCRTLQPLEIEPLSGQEFHTDATMRRMPGLAVNTVSRSAVIHNRRREFVDNDDIGITVGLTSSFEASQCGRALTMDPGDAIVLTGAEAASLTAPTCGKYIHLRVPKRSLSPLVAHLDAAYGQKVPARNAALRLLTRYIGILDESGALATLCLRRQVVAHVYDLIALAIGATEDAAESAANRGAPAALLWAIKQDVADHLDEPRLSIAAVAARHELMPRYVQRLFEREGTTFTAYLLEQRLAQAHRALIDPRYSGRKISAIAFDAGFGDLSYFNRTFRRQYGSVPSDVRATTALPSRSVAMTA